MIIIKMISKYGVQPTLRVITGIGKMLKQEKKKMAVLH
jgi:hypothetical protein